MPYAVCLSQRMDRVETGGDGAAGEDAGTLGSNQQPAARATAHSGSHTGGAILDERPAASSGEQGARAADHRDVQRGGHRLWGEKACPHHGGVGRRHAS